VFLDRDGVILRDNGPITQAAEMILVPGVVPALCRLGSKGFLLVVVTNQAVVARGLIAEDQLVRLHEELQRILESHGAPRLDAIYYCPHHPQADVIAYRRSCDCRKPGIGMFLRAAKEVPIDLQSSFMIGDRYSDAVAGSAAGCTTILLEGPGTWAPPIVGAEDAPPGRVDARVHCWEDAVDLLLSLQSAMQ
jgi:D-glycero-D-manno-heptose 1,7-bisphosphate phosphatase